MARASLPAGPGLVFTNKSFSVGSTYPLTHPPTHNSSQLSLTQPIPAHLRFGRDLQINTLTSPVRRCSPATLLHPSRCSHPAKAHFDTLACAGPGLQCATVPVMSLPTPSTPWIAALPLQANCRCSLAHLIQRAGKDVQRVAVLH